MPGENLFYHNLFKIHLNLKQIIIFIHQLSPDVAALRMRENRPLESEAHRLHVPTVYRCRESPQSEEDAEEGKGGYYEGGEIGTAASKLASRSQVLQFAPDQPQLCC